jgi:hypothetical protein
MLRRLFTLASALSLLLCVATAALWVRSYRVADGASWQEHGRNYSFHAMCGGAVFHCQYGDYRPGYDAYQYPHPERMTWSSYANPDYSVTEWRSSEEAVGPRYRLLGFAYEHRTWPAGTELIAGGGRWTAVRSWMIAIPAWAIVGVFAVLPLAWVRRRWRRPRAGCCGKCGYDLRATPGRCPECGEMAGNAAC